jgi:glycine dehydrogenase subunit 1
MPFIPHTDNDIKEMLLAIGVDSIDSLFNEIPKELRCGVLKNIPDGMSELETMHFMQARAKQITSAACYLGAGAYEHHIPAAVWDIMMRGEFLTAYTPYQAEASQGTLQVLYEYQTMMASLMGMEVSNASLYDGATAMGEAILMAVRLQKQPRKQVFVLGTVHPHYQQTVKAIVNNQGIELVEIPYDPKTGITALEQLSMQQTQTAAALVIQQPNFFGGLEAVDQLTDWAHEHSLLVIGVVNPLAVALLKEPGQWGRKGADIACGEGQPLGVPLASGGPYFGFLCTRLASVRQMPARIVGCTVDQEGRKAFTLTLQAREQHIRRSKATSNICTSQSLLAMAATIYMSLLGPEGLKRTAAVSHHQARLLLKKLLSIPGVELVFSAPFFHEFVLRLPRPVEDILRALSLHDIQGGLCLKPYYPALGECLLIAVTETKTESDLEHYFQSLRDALL